jgi:hypothetical protein
MTIDTTAVISGKPYAVTTVGDGAQPTTLTDFTGDTVFHIDLDGRSHSVPGCGQQQDGLVRYHQHDPGGRDVRVWHVTPTGDGFAAEQASAF